MPAELRGRRTPARRVGPRKRMTIRRAMPSCATSVGQCCVRIHRRCLPRRQSHSSDGRTLSSRHLPGQGLRRKLGGARTVSRRVGGELLVLELAPSGGSRRGTRSKTAGRAQRGKPCTACYRHGAERRDPNGDSRSQAPERDLKRAEAKPRATAIGGYKSRSLLPVSRAVHDVSRRGRSNYEREAPPPEGRLFSRPSAVGDAQSRMAASLLTTYWLSDTPSRSARRARSR
jgi:hypothetical protein